MWKGGRAEINEHNTGNDLLALAKNQSSKCHERLSSQIVPACGLYEA